MCEFQTQLGDWYLKYLRKHRHGMNAKTSVKVSQIAVRQQTITWATVHWDLKAPYGITRPQWVKLITAERNVKKITILDNHFKWTVYHNYDIVRWKGNHEHTPKTRNTHNHGNYQWSFWIYELSQWEEALHSNASSHWPSPYPEWSLIMQLKTKGCPTISNFVPCAA